MTKKKKNGGKRLTAQELQIEILKFLLGHPKKTFAPRQITDLLRVENNRDSTEHALQQLVQAGSVAEFAENKFGIAPESPDRRRSSAQQRTRWQSHRWGGKLSGKFQKTRSSASKTGKIKYRPRFHQTGSLVAQNH